jgi:hypothetical protein
MDSRPPRFWILGRTGGRLLCAALGVVLVGCASPAPSPTPSATSPVRAAATDGAYRLDLELSRATWASKEAIEGTATLSYTGAGAVTVAGSGSGPIYFAYVELGGTRHMGWAGTPDCRFQDLSAGAPISTGLKKAGGWSGEDPNASFYASFFADPEVHLPAGDWTITAISEFGEGTCGTNDHKIQATVQIHVTA